MSVKIDQKLLDRELAPWKLRFPQPGYDRLLQYVERLRNGTPIKRDKHRTREECLVALPSGYVVEDGVVERFPSLFRLNNPEDRFLTVDHDIRPDVVDCHGKTYDVKGHPSRDFVQAKPTTADFYIWYMYHDTCFYAMQSSVVRAKYPLQKSPTGWDSLVHIVPLSDLVQTQRVKFYSPLLMSEPIEVVQERIKRQAEEAQRLADELERENDNNIDFGAD